MAYANNRPGGQRQGQNRYSAPVQQLDLSFLDGPLAQAGVIRPGLLTMHARKCGETFARSRDDKVNGGQMRKFYSDVLGIAQKAAAGESAEKLAEADRAKVEMLSSKVAYARGRKTVSQSFAMMIDKCVNRTTSKGDLEAFRVFMEAVVGYFYGAGGGRNA